MKPFTLTTAHIKLAVEILFGILIVVLLLRQQSCNRPPEPTTRGTADSTFYWKNKHDQVVASQKAMEAQFAVIDARMKHILDSVAKVYDTKTRNIRELVIASMKGKSDIPVDPGTAEVDHEAPRRDSCPPQITRMRQQFRNAYYLARVQLGDSAYMQLHSVDTITQIWKVVKEGGIFKRRKYLQLDMHNANPDMTITGLTAYRRLDKIRQVAIGPEVRMMYLDRELRSMAGLNLSRQTGAWEVSLSGGKDFTRDLDIRTNGWYGEARAVLKLIRL